MNFRRPLFLFALSLGLFTAVGAQDAIAPAPAPSDPAAAPLSPAITELKALVERIQAKLQGGQPPTAESLAPELTDFTKLVAKYRDPKSDEAAQIALMQATLYGEVLNDTDKMKHLIVQLRADFPDTKVGAMAAKVIDQMAEQAKAEEKQAQAEQAAAALVGKPAPQLHFKWAAREGLKTLADLKGKVVVLDFWATWCGPCVRSFPEVAELTAHYQGMDVVVVGVTSIQGSITGLEPKPIDTKGEPQREIALLKDYIAAKKITWTIAVSDEEVFNPDYGISGIPHMVIIAPDGTLRHRGLHPSEPLSDKVDKIDAILKEFKLPVIASAANK